MSFKTDFKDGEEINIVNVMRGRDPKTSGQSDGSAKAYDGRRVV